MTGVKFISERNCCGENDIQSRYDAPSFWDNQSGVWIRSKCCGRIHWCEKPGPNEQV